MNEVCSENRMILLLKSALASVCYQDWWDTFEAKDDLMAVAQKLLYLYGKVEKSFMDA